MKTKASKNSTTFYRFYLDETKEIATVPGDQFSTPDKFAGLLCMTRGVKQHRISWKKVSSAGPIFGKLEKSDHTKMLEKKRQLMIKKMQEYKLCIQAQQ